MQRVLDPSDWLCVHSCTAHAEHITHAEVGMHFQFICRPPGWLMHTYFWPGNPCHKYSSPNLIQEQIWKQVPIATILLLPPLGMSLALQIRDELVPVHTELSLVTLLFKRVPAFPNFNWLWLQNLLALYHILKVPIWKEIFNAFIF